MDEGPEHITAPLSDIKAFSVASWNVNSIKARLPLLSAYLKEYAPDVVLLQEIKTETDAFPVFEMTAEGYHVLAKGQKSYNGVAVLTRAPAELVRDTLPGAPDGGEQARYIEARTRDGARFISVYVPNGQPSASDPEGTERLEYKTAWLDALKKQVDILMKQDDPFILGGDFNVIEFDGDVYDPRVFSGGAFTVPAVRERFRALHFAGLTNALRARAPEFPLYSYWDYQEGAWPKNNGILLDHIFLSPFFADRLDKAGVSTAFRGREKASDHAPVWCSFI